MINAPVFNPRLTVSVPCYGRPQRTIRAVECIAKQKSHNFEALVTGDGCPIMRDFIKSGEFIDLQKEVEKKGSQLIIRNNYWNFGHHGYHVTNQHIKEAEGRYFMFYANDDIILENHFENYLSEIERTDYGFVYFDSFVKPNDSIRVSKLEHGHIGHSEIIVKTALLKNMPPHSSKYGHDWTLIENLMKSGNEYVKAKSKTPTYYVMSLPDNKEPFLD